METCKEALPLNTVEMISYNTRITTSGLQVHEKVSEIARLSNLVVSFCQKHWMLTYDYCNRFHSECYSVIHYRTIYL